MDFAWPAIVQWTAILLRVQYWTYSLLPPSGWEKARTVHPNLPTASRGPYIEFVIWLLSVSRPGAHPTNCKEWEASFSRVFCIALESKKGRKMLPIWLLLSSFLWPAKKTPIFLNAVTLKQIGKYVPGFLFP